MKTALLVLWLANGQLMQNDELMAEAECLAIAGDVLSGELVAVDVAGSGRVEVRQAACFSAPLPGPAKLGI